MKRMLGLMAILVLAVLTAAAQSVPELKGKWSGKDGQGVTGSMEFIDSNRVVIVAEGEKMTVAYTVIYTSNTHKISMRLPEREGGAVLHGVFQHPDSETMRIQLFFDGSQPESFDESRSANIMLLKKESLQRTVQSTRLVQRTMNLSH